MYSLRRERDGVGQEGMGCRYVYLDENGKLADKKLEKPEVGVAVQVSDILGSWWCTTIITEILDETENDETVIIQFKTGNSTYTWQGSK